MLLLNHTHPYLRILVPETGEYVSFVGGKLEIDEDDPGYAAALAEAKRSPYITIIDSATYCPECGEGFDGKNARGKLSDHRKEIHFDAWQADQEAEHAERRNVALKSREGFVCDVCSPTQAFGTQADLVLHTRALHANAPSLDERGETIGEPDRSGPAPVEPEEIPSATRTGGRSRSKT